MPPIAPLGSRLTGRARTLAVVIALVAALILSTAPYGTAQANSRYGAIIIDAFTGTVLYEDRADKSLYPASLTKIMTLLMVFEALERGEVSLDQRLPVSKRAAGMPPSKLYLREGSTIRLEDAMYALVTKSANDAAVVVAEALGGSEIQFARMMTERARSIGMVRTSFRNASGLPNRHQKSTARDMATLARYIISRYPEYYAYFSTKRFSYAGKTYRNHNRLLGDTDGVDGIKTGYIRAAGFNLVSSAERNGRRIIAVVFGGRTAASRNAHMRDLVERGFRIASQRGIMIAGTAPLPKAKPPLAVAFPVSRLQEVAMMSKPVYVRDPATAPEQHLIAAAADRAVPEVMMENALTDAGAADVAAQPAPSRLTAQLASAVATDDSDPPIAQGDIDPGGNDTSEPGTGLSVSLNESTVATLLGNWAVQVGAFRSEDRSTAAIDQARGMAPDQLAWAQATISPLVTGRGTLYRARLAGLDEPTAKAACDTLKTYGFGCLPIRTGAPN